MKTLQIITAILVCYISVLFTIVCMNKIDKDNSNTSCPYEYGECPNPECSNFHSNTYLRDYQIELHLDTMWLYDGKRLVGMHIDTTWNHGAWLDSTMMKDNL